MIENDMEKINKKLILCWLVINNSVINTNYQNVSTVASTICINLASLLVTTAFLSAIIIPWDVSFSHNWINVVHCTLSSFSATIRSPKQDSLVGKSRLEIGRTIGWATGYTTQQES